MTDSDLEHEVLAPLAADNFYNAFTLPTRLVAVRRDRRRFEASTAGGLEAATRDILRQSSAQPDAPKSRNTRGVEPLCGIDPVAIMARAVAAFHRKATAATAVTLTTAEHRTWLAAAMSFAAQTDEFLREQARGRRRKLDALTAELAALNVSQYISDEAHPRDRAKENANVWTAAIHEAGHAVVGFVLGAPVRGAVANLDGSGSAGVGDCPGPSSDEAVMLAGGAEAESLFRVGTGYMAGSISGGVWDRGRFNDALAGITGIPDAGLGRAGYAAKELCKNNSAV